MDLKVLRCGIAGSGYAAKFHYEALKRVFGVRVEIEEAYSPVTLATGPVPLTEILSPVKPVLYRLSQVSEE